MRFLAILYWHIEYVNKQKFIEVLYNAHKNFYSRKSVLVNINLILSWLEYVQNSRLSTASQLFYYYFEWCVTYVNVWCVEQTVAIFSAVLQVSQT